MAKKQEQKNEKEAEPETAPKVESPKNNDKFSGLQAGRIVHFHREVNSGNGVQLITLAAIVIGHAAKESNLPAGSVDLGVHSRAGYETRFGVMHSDSPKAGHWSWCPHL